MLILCHNNMVCDLELHAIAVKCCFGMSNHTCGVLFNDRPGCSAFLLFSRTMQGCRLRKKYFFMKKRKKAQLSRTSETMVANYINRVKYFTLQVVLFKLLLKFTIFCRKIIN